MGYVYPDAYLHECRESLLHELVTAHSGKDSSLTFARHTLYKPEVPENRIHVIVIGGTNLLSAVVSNNNGTLTLESKQKLPLPVLDSEKTLFGIIASCINQLRLQSVAINFAYPLEPVEHNGLLDGKLIRATKEHTMNGLIGEVVGDSFTRYYQKTYNKSLSVSVANDTVCLVLAGLGHSDAEQLAGGVIGTGFNFGFFLDSATVINLESGNFNRFVQSIPGIEIDKSSNNPGRQQWEKEVAGAYLYLHYNYFAKEQGFELIDSTYEMSTLAEKNNPEGELARMVLRHSAAHTAVEIAAICDFRNNYSLNFIIEGSLFWYGHNYHDYVLEHLARMDVDSVILFRQENSSILGGARLLL